MVLRPFKMLTADVITREQLPEQSANNHLWWNGQKYLNTSNYEVDVPVDVPDQMLPEMKEVIVMSAIPLETFSIFCKYNNFRKIQGIMANILRLKNCRTKQSSEHISSP